MSSSGSALGALLRKRQARRAASDLAPPRGNGGIARPACARGGSECVKIPSSDRLSLFLSSSAGAEHPTPTWNLLLAPVTEGGSCDPGDQSAVRGIRAVVVAANSLRVPQHIYDDEARDSHTASNEWRNVPLQTLQTAISPDVRRDSESGIENAARETRECVALVSRCVSLVPVTRELYDAAAAEMEKGAAATIADTAPFLDWAAHVEETIKVNELQLKECIDERIKSAVAEREARHPDDVLDAVSVPIYYLHLADFEDNKASRLAHVLTAVETLVLRLLPAHAVAFNFDALGRPVASRGPPGVLIHCQQGVSRSASLIAALLMRVDRLDLADAVARITSVRAVANPNVGFRIELFAMMRATAEEEQLQDDA